MDLYVRREDVRPTPIFTYKYKGFLNGSQSGNYYQIENAPGFHLVCDHFGQLFAPVEERAQILAYYSDWANLEGHYDNWADRQFIISDDAQKVVQNLLNLDMDSLPQQKVTVEEAQEFRIKILCKEGIVFVESRSFVCFNQRVYYVRESCYSGNYIEYTVTELPPEMEAVLLQIHQTGT